MHAVLLDFNGTMFFDTRFHMEAWSKIYHELHPEDKSPLASTKICGPCNDEWKDIVYHKYNDDFTSYECVPCYNSVDEYIASEKEDLESYKADLEEALEELKDMRADWKPEKEPNMNEEIELIKKWVKEREDFINE